MFAARPRLAEHHVFSHPGARSRKLGPQGDTRYLPGLAICNLRASGARRHDAMTPNAQCSAWSRRGETDVARRMRYRLTDRQNSVTLELDADAHRTGREVFYPFGGTAQRLAASQCEAADTAPRYSGKPCDASGLYAYGFRHYAPWLGRWASPDPAGAADGLNLFAMVRNNPVTLHDDEGLASGDEASPPNSPPRHPRKRWCAAALREQESAALSSAAAAPPAPDTVQPPEAEASSSAATASQPPQATGVPVSVIVSRAPAAAARPVAPVAPVAPIRMATESSQPAAPQTAPQTAAGGTAPRPRRWMPLERTVAPHGHWRAILRGLEGKLTNGRPTRRVPIFPHGAFEGVPAEAARLADEYFQDLNPRSTPLSSRHRVAASVLAVARIFLAQGAIEIVPVNTTVMSLIYGQSRPGGSALRARTERIVAAAMGIYRHVQANPGIWPRLPAHDEHICDEIHEGGTRGGEPLPSTSAFYEKAFELSRQLQP